MATEPFIPVASGSTTPSSGADLPDFQSHGGRNGIEKERKRNKTKHTYIIYRICIHSIYYIYILCIYIYANMIYIYIHMHVSWYTIHHRLSKILKCRRCGNTYCRRLGAAQVLEKLAMGCPKSSISWPSTRPRMIPWCMEYGYGSKPINTIFSGMNIHLPAILMWTEGVQGFDTLPYLPIHGMGMCECQKHPTLFRLWSWRRCFWHF